MGAPVVGCVSPARPLSCSNPRFGGVDLDAVRTAPRCEGVRIVSTANYRPVRLLPLQRSIQVNRSLESGSNVVVWTSSEMNGASVPRAAGGPGQCQLARRTSPCRVFNLGTTIGTVNIVLRTAITSRAVNVSLEMI